MITKSSRARTITQKTVTCFCTLECSLGNLLLATNDSALTGIYFADRNHVPAASREWKQNAKHPILLQTEQQLREYLAGKRKRFSVPLHLEGTDFQKSIWNQIALIPYGQTITYSELASRAGASHAIRAAGTTTGRNPISIIVPCHRVMGKNGTLCGFAGGLERKEQLLALENKELPFL